MKTDSKPIQFTCSLCKQTFTAQIPEHFAAAIERGQITHYALCDSCEYRTRNIRPEIDSGSLLISEAEKTKMWNDLCPPLYRETSPAKLPDLKSYNSVQAYQYGPRGLIMLGETGTGKTRSMYKLLERLFYEGHSMKIFRPLEFGDVCAEMYRTGRGKYWTDELVYDYDIMAIDDFGKVVLTDRVESTLFGVIEERISRLKPIILTTNMTGSTLEHYMSADRGPTLVRRLREFCRSVTFRPAK